MARCSCSGYPDECLCGALVPFEESQLTRMDCGDKQDPRSLVEIIADKIARHAPGLN